MNAPFKVKFLKLYNKTFLGNFLSTSVTNVNLYDITFYAPLQ